MKSDYVSTNGVRLHYLRTGGDKPQVLLLHGLTDNGACWNPVIEALNADFDFIAPDARGHGLSDAPAQGYRPEDHAADAAGLIQALKLKRPVVVGHSMGGMQSTVLAAQHPELVRAVVVEDPAWFGEDNLTPDQRRERAKGWAENLQRDQSKTKTELIAQGHAQNPGWSDAELDPWSDAKLQARVQVLEYVEHQASDWRGLLKQITYPLLLVTGDTTKGVIITPQMAHEAQLINPKVEVANIPNTGHCIRRDDFGGYIAAFGAFLRRVTV